MLRLFGETADSTASFSAQNGDRISESPLRELALRVPAPDSNASAAADALSPARSEQDINVADLSGVGASYLARAADAGLLSTQVRFDPSTPSRDPRIEALGTQSALYTAAYQPVEPTPRISPDPGTLAFDAPSAQITVPDSAGAAFVLNPAGHETKRSLSLSLSGQSERAAPDDLFAASPALDTSSQWQLPGASVALTIPNYAGANRLSLGAGLAVPVFHGLTLNLNYNAERSYGGYALPGLENLDAANNLYVSRLTYDIPYSSSSFSISAYQNRFGESVLPVNGYTQTGEDVNFTVKF
jgi:hypothetical protein